MKEKSIYNQHLEWEFSIFPIEINYLKFEKNNFGVREGAIISVWRDENYKLNAKIITDVIDLKKCEKEDFIGKGNIVKGQLITGYDNNGNIVEMHNCLLTNIIAGDVSVDYIKIKFLNSEKSDKSRIRLDWFLCQESKAHLWGRTLRNPKLASKKIRVGIDGCDDSIENIIGGSSSKDYTLVCLPDFKFIVSKVPEKLLPLDRKGICFEFRENFENIDDELIRGIENYLSFLLGHKLHYIGFSILSEEKLVESHLYSLSELKSDVVMPPIRFNTKYEWGDLSFLLNQYLTNYLSLSKTLPLNESLSRFWIFKNTPLGSNLPILASTLEIIVAAYLKNNNYKSEYLSEEDYSNLIKEEKDKIETKFKNVKGGDIIVNKILGAFRKGPNEKMIDFFSLIEIELGDLEKKAINLRNKMAHASRDYSEDKNVHDDLILTRVYQVLFHRTILKLLNYDGYYIDYATQGSPLRHIDKKSGK